MKFRLGLLCVLLTSTLTFAGDGIPARGSAEDYTAHDVSGRSPSAPPMSLPPK